MKQIKMAHFQLMKYENEFGIPWTLFLVSQQYVS